MSVHLSLEGMEYRSFLIRVMGFLSISSNCVLLRTSASIPDINAPVTTALKTIDWN